MCEDKRFIKIKISKVAKISLTMNFVFLVLLAPQNPLLILKTSWPFSELVVREGKERNHQSHNKRVTLQFFCVVIEFLSLYIRFAGFIVLFSVCFGSSITV